MQRKIMSLLVILTLAMTASAFAADQQGPPQRDGDRPRHHGDGDGPRGDRHDGPPRPGMMIVGALRQLDLTADQKEAVKGFMQDFRKSAEQWRDEHKDQLDAIFAKLKKARTDKDREAGKAAMDELRKLHESGPDPKDLIEKIKGQLTEAQAAKLDQIVKQARDRMDKHRDGDGPDGQQGDRPHRRPRDNNNGNQ